MVWAMNTPIQRYRVLTEQEVDLVNFIKDAGNGLQELTNALSMYEGVDKRWHAIAVTHLQQGIMALVRSITKPESF